MVSMSNIFSVPYSYILTANLKLFFFLPNLDKINILKKPFVIPVNINIQKIPFFLVMCGIFFLMWACTDEDN